jgi:urea transport system ATP-binding protein
MLKVENLNQKYGGSHILRDLSFDLKIGEVTCLLGRNGAGKTTLLKTLMGIEKSASGNIVFDGSDMTHEPSYKRVRHGIGYVPQGREIFPRLTVLENLNMGLASKSSGTPLPPRI